MSRKPGKTGRNDPCPCGSGKKYKKCCMGKEEIVTPEALQYRRLSRAFESLVPLLEEHAERIFGEQAIKCAFYEFWGWPVTEEESPDPEAVERSLTLLSPWFLFNWEYDEDDEDCALAGPPGRTVAELYAEKMGDSLDSSQRALIEATNRVPYTFWEALRVDPGRRVHLKDVLTGEEITVEERTGSQEIRAGEILFGRAVSVDGVGMLIGLSAFRIPASYKADLIGIRKKMKGRKKALTRDDLHDWDLELRQYFLGIDRQLHNPPQMTNTDGDPLEFHKVVFRIESAEDAVDKLAPLCVTDSVEEIRKEAETGPDGRIRRAKIAWSRTGHKKSPGLPNTVLGHIVVEDDRISVEVNSARRAGLIREEIEKRLGDQARFQVDRIEDFEAAMGRQMAEYGGGPPDQEELMQSPEVQKQLAETLTRHWEGWVDIPLPALDGKTPRKAVKTKDGREAVEALLADAERSASPDPVMDRFNRKGIRLARKLLGLADPESGGGPGE